MIDYYLAKLAPEVDLNNSPLAVNVALFCDVGSSDFRFKPHLEVPNRPPVD